tara:strand:- start:282 stop:734 length:453 start_codon:yes stop_codon:yes gene_type:complete
MAINIDSGLITRKGGANSVVVAGNMNPSQDLLWTIPFNGNHTGGNGYVLHIRWLMNHWNTANYYKYNEGYYFGRGGQTSYQRIDLGTSAGTGSASWSSGHLDITIAGSGGTSPNNQLLKVQYDADGAPAYGSAYILEVNFSGSLGALTIS